MATQPAFLRGVRSSRKNVRSPAAKRKIKKRREQNLLSFNFNVALGGQRRLQKSRRPFEFPFPLLLSKSDANIGR